MLLLKLLLAHLIGDFGLQPANWVKDKLQKRHRSPYLYLHIGIHALLLLILLAGELTTFWPAIILIVISHFMIDLGKLMLQGRFNKRLLFFADQLLHLLVIALVSYLYFPFPLSWDEILTPSLLLWIIALSAVTYVAAVVIMMMISVYRPVNEEDKDGSLARAGRYIGMLERLFVFGFVVSNHWEGIGFLIAAKSVFRFGDLKQSKDRKLTEYILIGTLLSFGIAILCGVVFKKLLIYYYQA